jgi:hypothetical protein
LTREYLPAIKQVFFVIYCVKPLYGKSMATSSSPLSIAASRTLQAVRAAGGGGGASVTPLVRFDFAGGNTMIAPEINTVGFSWTGTTRPVEASSSGALGMRFRFGPDGPIEDSTSEQNYEFNGQYVEVYERFTVVTPSNFRTRVITVIPMASIANTSAWVVGDTLFNNASYYGTFEGSSGSNIYILNGTARGASGAWFNAVITNTTRSTSATSSPGSDGLSVPNNKFCALWGGAYSTNGTGVVEYTPAYNGFSNVDGNIPTHQFGQTDTHGTQGNRGSSGGEFQLLSAGATHEYTVRRRKSSAQGVTDALAEIWKDGALVYYDRNGLNFDTTFNFYERGYLFGWSNSGFKEQTDIYVTKYEFYGANRPNGLA